MSGFGTIRRSFRELPGWLADDPAPALSAFIRSARYAIESNPYGSPPGAPSHADCLDAYRAALALDREGFGAESARAFFEAWFEPFEIVPGPGSRGHVTAFYEPVVEVRAQADDVWRFPFLRRPPALKKIADPDNPPPGIPEGHAFGLEVDGRLRTCPDRRAIETGAFAGQGLEIAYARDAVDVFFAHVQGAARLDHGDGTVSRVTYDGKSGHPFTGIGRLLVDRGEIAQADISMQAIRSWLASHPDAAFDLMWQNRSFIFFREADVDDPRLGPVAAAKVPLEPGRSIAVDKAIHRFGTPFFVSAPNLSDFDRPAPFARLMIAQDTGSAILGPARGDLFTGSGPEAGALAGGVNAVATFHALLPRGFEPRSDSHRAT